MLGTIVVALFLWLAASLRSLHARRTYECALRSYLVGAFRRFHFTVDPNAYEFDYLTTPDGTCLSLYVLEAEPGSPVLVFMPGTAAYAQIYSNFLFALRQRGFTVVGYDPRGHGRSGRLRGYFTIAEMVADARAVAAWARQRFGTKVAFAGSSQGGVVGLYLAATGDPNVTTVMCHDFAWLDGRTILEISKFKPPVFLVPLFVWLFRLLRAFVVPVTFYLPFGDLKVPDGTSAVAFLKQDPLATTAYSLGAVASLTRTPLARPLGEIKMPVMLLSSTEDQVFPVAYLQRIFDRLTCPKQFTLIEGLPHLLLINHVDRVIDPICEWLDRWLRGKA